MEPQEACGLVIKLEKDTLGKRHNGDNYVLGYYDRLDIQPIYNWFSYSPGNVLAEQKKPDGGQTGEPVLRPISYYPIKLVFPANEVSSRLEELGLNYSSWKRSRPLSGKTNEDFSTFFDSYPCISVVLINLTDQFKGDFPRDVCTEQLERLAQVIKKGNYQIGETITAFDREAFHEAHCCILPSLGYSDYCILFAEKSWSLGPAVLEYLHEATVQVKAEPEPREVPVLSTDYLMPVYHVPSSGGQNPVSVNSHENGIQLGIRVNLRPGVSMRALKQKVGNMAEVFHITGSTDCLLISESGQDFSDLLRVIMPKHPQGNKIIENLVIDTESMLRRRIPEDVAENQPNPAEEGSFASSTVLEDSIRDLRAKLLDYQELLTREHRHMRRLNAMHERVTSIENICGESHNLGFQFIMNEWLLAFNSCFGICLREIRERIDAMAAGAKTEEEAARFKQDLKNLWTKTEDAMDFFIQKVGSFMADLSRSDCFFMESERYNHPSVGSATALLIAYNQWQNSFAKAVMQEPGSGESVYTFLVQSGGCDATRTKNLFWFLPPDIAPDNTLIEKLPLIIQMSEMSLFDCSGTVFRMTHECMHLCGKRHRVERVEHLIRFTSWLYARFLSETFFHKSTYFEFLKARLQERMFPGAPASLYHALEACWKNQSEKFTEALADFLIKELDAAYTQARADWTEVDYMSSDFCDWLRDQLSDLFSCYAFSRGNGKDVLRIGRKAWAYNTFSSFIYKTQLTIAQAFYEACEKILKTYEDTLDFCALESRKLGAALESISSGGRRHDRFVDSNLERSIPLILSQFMTNPSYHSMQELPFSTLRRNGLEEILRETVIDCFSESFADLEACMRLEASISDYLLAFVFENWNLDSAFALDPPLYFRVSAVLSVYYTDCLRPDKLALTAETREKLCRAVQCMEGHGLPQGRIDGNGVANHVDALLRRYQEYPKEAEALENYLRTCMDSFTDSDRRNMAVFRTTFQKISLSNIPYGSDSAASIFTGISNNKGIM